MKHHLKIASRHHTEFIDITDSVQKAVDEDHLDEGIVTVFIPHTTAGVTINENADPDVLRDLAVALDKAVPWHGEYHHGEGNSAAHAKSSLVGCSLNVMIEKGRLQLGTWQGIFFCEFDGPRSRSAWVMTTAR